MTHSRENLLGGDVREGSREQPRVARAEVRVPVPDRVRLVQDGRHTGILASLALGVVLVAELREAVRRRREQQRLARGADLTDSASWPQHLGSLTVQRKPPQGFLLLGLARLRERVRARRQEQQRPVRREDGGGVPLGGAGEPDGVPLTSRPQA